MLIDDYVAELERALVGPARVKRDLVVEARDGLCDAAEALEAGGLARAEAERLAVEEFGPVGEIAPGFQEELVACAGRRQAWLLFLGVPATALCWTLVWQVFPYPVAEWTERPEWFVPVARALDILQLAAGMVAGVTILLLRRRPPQRLTRRLGIFTWTLLACTGVLSLCLMFGSRGPAGFGGYPPGMLISAASLAFTAAQVVGAARCLRVTRATALS
ncbi:permease prefix domain 1-containing protein [Nonomuraea sp. NPDC050328]|uniref:permease prefix domain 1-containing protein n=1 Tax=Nonomuraea sp. NPDC050328 TaxID=3364361 RepID=UPI00378A1041